MFMSQPKNRRRVFITGGAGFVGTNLAKYFLDKGGFDLTVYDNLSVGSQANLNRAVADSKAKGSVDFIKGDILDFDRLSSAVTGHDALVHLAAHTDVRQSIEDPCRNVTVNSMGTFNAIEAARTRNVDKFVFASSNAAVGEQILPVNESMVPRPLSPYGAVKLYGEALCSAYYHSYGLKTVALRFANAYGPYSEHKTSVVAKFIRIAKQGRVIEVYGDGTQTRDFIHARDISQAVYLAVSNESLSQYPWGQIFQIATGCETSVIDLAKKIMEHADLSPENIKHTPAVQGEIMKNFSDIAKAKDVLNFEPNTTIEKGLNEMVGA